MWLLTATQNMRKHLKVTTMFSELYLTGPCLRRWNITGVGHPVSPGLANGKTKGRLEKNATFMPSNIHTGSPQNRLRFHFKMLVKD